MNKIKIAVSSCLLGEPVRYDGTDKQIKLISDELANEYNLVSLCPEMAVGMGVPRPPIQLVDNGVDIEVLGVADPSVNMTQPLKKYANEVINNYMDICGYIFKKNSPSCGTKNVKVLGLNGNYELKGQGIYAESIIQALPELPVIDEEDFLISANRMLFLSRVKLYYKQVSSQ